MGGVGPPKCKTCGIAEWRHLCSGGGVVIAGVRLDEDGEFHVAPRKAVVSRVAGAALPQPALLEAKSEDERVGDAAMKPAKRGRPKKLKAPVTDRKEYLKLKARERRAKGKGVPNAKGEGST